MAKKKRVWYPGAVYHITNRGNRYGVMSYPIFVNPVSPAETIKNASRDVSQKVLFYGDLCNKPFSL